MSEPISIAEYAKRCGVSIDLVRYDIRQGRVHMLPRNRVDASHPESLANMEKRLNKSGGVPLAKRPNSASVKASTRKLSEVCGGPDEGISPQEKITDFGDYTLREIARRFGSQLQFIDVLNSVKKIAEIEEKELKNAAVKGKLIDRELVKIAVIGPMETTLPQILTDGAKQIANRVSVMTRAGAPLLDLEREVESILKSFLRPMRDKMLRGISK